MAVGVVRDLEERIASDGPRLPGYSSAQRPVMNTVAGTFSRRSVLISRGLSNRSPAAARGPWSAVMSASKVRATVLSRAPAAFTKTGVSPPGPGARVGGREGAVTAGAGAVTARGASGAPHAARATAPAVVSTQAAVALFRHRKIFTRATLTV